MGRIFHPAKQIPKSESHIWDLPCGTILAERFVHRFLMRFPPRSFSKTDKVGTLKKPAVPAWISKELRELWQLRDSHQARP